MRFSINGYSETAKINKFPTGELGVVLPKNLPLRAEHIKVVYDWVEYGNGGIIVLAQLLEALGQRYKHDAYTKTLVLPYVPYSRQDRVCNKGESLSIKVFANIINSFGFNEVETWDNHSDVATALLDNCTNITQQRILQTSFNISAHNSLLVCPDGGAVKKTRATAKAFGLRDILYCDKERDISTGQITATKLLNKECLENYSSALVLDDICDGGMTFVELAKVILDAKPDMTLYLYVTHGFFTKGLEELLVYYKTIYTTESVCRLNSDKLGFLREVK